MLPDFSSYSLDSVATNAMVAWAIQKMKTSDSPAFAWISSATPKITFALSALMAAATAAGMIVQWDVANGVGTLVIGGITPTAVLTFVWITLKNLVFQEGAYRAIFKPVEPLPPKPALPPPEKVGTL